MLLSVAVERAPGVVIGRRSESPSRLRVPERARQRLAHGARVLLVGLAAMLAMPPMLLFAAMVVLPVAPVLALSLPFALVGLRGDPAAAHRRRRRVASRSVRPPRLAEDFPLPLQGLARLAGWR